MKNGKSYKNSQTLRINNTLRMNCFLITENDEYGKNFTENFNFRISSPVRTNNIAGEADAMYSFFMPENDE
jgi:hypothetical protein